MDRFHFENFLSFEGEESIYMHKPIGNIILPGIFCGSTWKFFSRLVSTMFAINFRSQKLSQKKVTEQIKWKFYSISTFLYINWFLYLQEHSLSFTAINYFSSYSEEVSYSINCFITNEFHSEKLIDCDRYFSSIEKKLT